MNRSIATTILLLLFTIPLSQSVAQSDPAKVKTSMDKFLERGTVAGLTANALPAKLVNGLLDDNELWVGKCPICDNVRRGFRQYVKNDVPDSATSALNDEVLNGLKHESLSERKKALKTLIDGYVQDYFTVLSMTEEERKAMEIKLEKGRKTGMSRAGGGEGFYCSSCDGACHKPDQD